MNSGIVSTAARAVSLGVLVAMLIHPLDARAQELVDPSLQVSTVVSDLVQPIAMAFIGPDDFLVTEKASGQVKRVTNGVVTGVVLDLAVNSNSERGLLGIALHPRFPRRPYVYLYNTESSTGADTNVAAEVPLLGNRVDRFVWNGSSLVFDRNIIRLRSFQNDRNNVADPTLPVLRGNHNGGVLRFGPDRKLYIVIGDNGRRGWTQNNLEGPVPDDDFGGPETDDAHLTGVILRLNDDGTTPRDNPFYRLGRRDDDDRGHDATADDDNGDDDDDDDGDDDHGRANLPPLTPEVRANLQRIFAYGVRNSFGMTFDPRTGSLWNTENSGRAFDEINRVRAGSNNGWIQFMGPISRVAEYKAIEISVGFGANGPTGLQQMRFLPTSISDTPNEARARLFRLPGSRPNDPQFSWKQVVPPAALAFVNGDGLGDQYDGNLIVGSAVSRATNAGNLYRFRLNRKRTALEFEDPRLQDKVADNLERDDFVTEGEEILFGTNFGIVTDMQTGPEGALYLVSPGGTVRKISRP
ncbi:MAG: PQQ-dependent sugar dehydrogenase [Acidobacteriota bacterium]|nr:PQQ-dependent sugar dehydrogenase [Acidobacteriota bacterium]